MKVIVVLAVILVVILTFNAGCTANKEIGNANKSTADNPNNGQIVPAESKSDNIPDLDQFSTREFREFTYNNCRHLLNTTVNFKGKILFEQCNKNCLDGCPSKGGSYCYYGLLNENNCVVYIKKGLAQSEFKDITFKKEIEISGNVTIYYGPYCNFVEGEGYVTKVPKCSYFVIGGVW